MALFWKESINNENVSLSDAGYPGTGVKVNVGDVVVISNLAANKSYKLACGGYTQDNVWVNGIGEQTDEIVPLLPLNWSIIFGYLAIISKSFSNSNRLDHHQISKRAAESLLKEYIMKNEIKYPQLNVYTNGLFTYWMNYKLIMHASPWTVRQIIESFIILAKISKMYKNEEKQITEENKPLIVKQKADLKLINFLMLALELSLGINNPAIIKRLVWDIYNYLRPYLSYENHPPLIKYCLLFWHQSIRWIPREQMDSSTRRVGAWVAYELNKSMLYKLLSLPDKFYNRLLLSENQLELRKWRTYSKMVKRLDQLDEDQLALKQEQYDLIRRGGDLFHIEEKDMIKVT